MPAPIQMPIPGPGMPRDAGGPDLFVGVVVVLGAIAVLACALVALLR